MPAVTASGLDEFLIKHQKKVSETLRFLPRTGKKSKGKNKIILIDAAAFWAACVGAIQQNANTTAAEQPADLEQPSEPPRAAVLGGVLLGLEMAVHLVIETLTNVYGMELIFLVDGRHCNEDDSRLQMMLVNCMSSQKKQMRQVTEHLHLCDHRNGCASIEKVRNVFKSFASILGMHQVETEAIRCANTRVVQLDGEVGTHMAFLMKMFSADFFLTNSTKFTILPGVRTVLLQKLSLVDLLAPTTKELTLQVFSYDLLCKKLKNTDDQATLLAILAGDVLKRSKADLHGIHAGDFPTALQHLLAEKGLQDSGAMDPSFVLCGNTQNQSPPAETSAVPEGLPPSLWSMAEHGIVADESMPLKRRILGCYAHLSTFQRLRCVLGHIFGHAKLKVFFDGAKTPTVVDVVLPSDLTDSPQGHQILPALKLWKGLHRKQRLKRIAAIFFRPGRETLTLVPLFASCVLWTSHAGLYGAAELHLLALVLSFCSMTANQNRIRDALSILLHCITAQPGILEQMASPAPRLKQLAELLGHSLSSVTAIFQLIVPDAVKNAPSDGFFIPNRKYSDAALHVFASLVSTLSSTEAGTKNAVLTPTATALSMFEDAAQPIRETWRILLSNAEALFNGVALESTTALHYLTAPPCKDVNSFMATDKAREVSGNIPSVKPLDSMSDIPNSMTVAADPTAVGHLQICSPILASPTMPEGSKKEWRFPAEDHIGEVLAALRDHRVVCIQGDTGCGKSSIVPLNILLDAEKQSKSVFIVVTQPRRLAAVSLAKRVSSLLHEEVGHRVGYRIGGGVRHETRGVTSLLYVTTGYLLELLAHSDGGFFQRITHLILDEVHERSIQADMLSLVIKLTMLPRSKLDSDSNEREYPAPPNGKETKAAASCRMKWWSRAPLSLKERSTRLIIMSATISVDLFVNYFNPLAWARTAPVVHVGDKCFTVTEIYLDEFVRELTESKNQCSKLTLRAVQELSSSVCDPKKNPNFNRRICEGIYRLIHHVARVGTCILVFLPGLLEIEDMSRALENDEQKNPVKFRIHVVHSVVDEKMQELALEPAAADECKVVLSTNIAETSLTIPDVKVVIDLGFARRVYYDEKRDARIFKLCRCSQASARQRMGRAGRVSDGVVYRLYSRHMFEKCLKPFDEPDLYPLEYSILIVRKCLAAYGDVPCVMQSLVEPPPRKNVEVAIQRLTQLGILGPVPSLKITPIGHFAVLLPVEVTLARAIYRAVSYGCAAEMVVIAVGLYLPKSLIRRQCRIFFGTHFHYQKACFKAFQSISNFDKGRRNDLYAILSIYEEGRLSYPFRPNSKFLTDNMLSRSDFSILKRDAARIAQAVLSTFEILDPEDQETLRLLADTNLSVSVKPVQFRALRSEQCHYRLQVVLAEASHMTLLAQQNPTQKKYAESLVVLHGVSKALLPDVSDNDAEDIGEIQIGRQLKTILPVSSLRVVHKKSSYSLELQFHLNTEARTCGKSGVLPPLLPHPTAVPPGVLKMMRFALMSWRGRLGDIDPCFSYEKGVAPLHLPRPSTPSMLSLKGFITGERRVEGQAVSAMVKFKFDLWSSLGHESASYVEGGETLVAFAFNTLMKESGTCSASFGFFPFMATQSGEDMRFRFISFIFANMPTKGDVFTVSLRRQTSVVVDCAYHRVPMKNLLAFLGRSCWSAADVVLCLLQSMVLAMVPFFAEVDPSGRQKKKLLYLSEGIRSTARSIPLEDNTECDAETIQHHIQGVKYTSRREPYLHFAAWNITDMEQLVSQSISSDTKKTSPPAAHAYRALAFLGDVASILASTEYE